MTWVVETPQAMVPGRPIGAIDVLDHFASGDFLSGGPEGVPLADGERHAIEVAVAPIPVRWVHEEGETCVSRAGIEPGTTIDARVDIATVPARVTVLLAVPHIDGGNATMRHEVSCAPCCASGSTLVLARRPNGEWSVTGTTGGFIS